MKVDFIMNGEIVETINYEDIKGYGFGNREVEIHLEDRTLRFEVEDPFKFVDAFVAHKAKRIPLHIDVTENKIRNVKKTT